MILEHDIEEALKKVIWEANLGWQYTLPNVDATLTKPYIRFDFIRVNRRDDTLEGVQTISRGQVIATVVTAQNKATKLANQKADQIAALFPKGRRIAVTGGEIVFIKPADILEGFPQDGDWRVPVRADYEAS